MTPIKAFAVDEANLKIYTQDYAGNLTLVATCPNIDQLTWLVNSLTGYHRGVGIISSESGEWVPV